MANARAISDGGARVTKRKAGKQPKKPKKPKTDLLDVSNYMGSPHLEEVTKRNSMESPLLRLPPEIRNKIWKYAVGGLRVYIWSFGNRLHRSSSYSTGTIGAEFDWYSKSCYPTVAFGLQKVSRQTYFEASPFIYTLNTFCFRHSGDMDRWIKNRTFAQEQLVTSVDMPYQYSDLYIRGLRPSLQRNFPNIKRVGLSGSINFYRRCWIFEAEEKIKERIAEQIVEREGEGIMVEWY